jgi:hypothetical protein
VAEVERDLAYIAEMRRMEEGVTLAHEHQHQHQQHQPMPAVVPISGLIYSVLHRLENEHATALKHWRGRRPRS